jgi:hypothetical protein
MNVWLTVRTTATQLAARTATWLCALLLGFGGLPAHATNYQDWWWGGQAESGWGINLGHQGNTIFAAWFVYDVANNPVWFTAVASKPTGATNETFTGKLFQSRGDFYGLTPFTPRNAATEVGNATFVFTDAKTATLEYNVGSVVVRKNITRFFIAPLNLSGAFVGGSQRQYAGCAGSVPNGSITNSVATMQITTPANAASGTIEINIPGACIYRGNFQQTGSVIEGSGTYSCPIDGETGTWSGVEGTFNERAFYMRITQRPANGGATCVATTAVGGFKP